MRPLIITIGLLFIAGLLLSGCTETVTTSQVFPDPYVMGQGSNEVVFIDLAAVCTIEITMLDGSLVRRISETDGDGQASWDLKNQAGEDVVSGIYLYLIKSQSQEAKGRLIINK